MAHFRSTPPEMMERTSPIRVLVVDDSAFMRRAISTMLATAPDVEVIDTARDGVEAVEKVAALRPDVVTLDIEMPRMDGLTALRRIMASHPVPVLMVSSLTHEGAAATLEALEAGALDFIPKQAADGASPFFGIRDALITRIRAIAGRRPPRLQRRKSDIELPRLSFEGIRVLAIGTSTGGPFALQQVIPLLPRDFPLPIIVAQHMPPRFTRSLAERLDRTSTLQVKEAESGDAVIPGRVLIAPGGRHLILTRHGEAVEALTPDRPETLHRPSVDVMLDAACEVYDGRVAALIMTGMGRDGRDGCRRIKDRGGLVIAQDEASSVVYGMPRGVIEAGLAHAVVSLAGIAPTCIGGINRTIGEPLRIS